MPFKRVLVAVDYSPNSRIALEYAAQLTQEVGGTLTVVHVWDRPAYVSDSVTVGHG